MLVLAHTGITLGAVTLLTQAFSRRAANSQWPIVQSQQKLEVNNPRLVAKITNSRLTTADSELTWFTSLGKRIDIRILFVGSLLPDIIDKPLGMLFLRDTFSNGRIFAHTLLFLAIITLVGVYLHRSRGRLWLLILSFGTFIHLILDQMWLYPRTLLWPLYGFSFPKGEVQLVTWLGGLLHALFTEPSVYVSEITGGMILIWFALTVIRQKKVYAFIRDGAL